MYKAGTITIVALSTLFLASFLHAQSTQFTYQGSLTDGAVPATGSYDFEFRLFDALTGGNQISVARAFSGVPVTNGIFSVNLDFFNAFPGENRYLDIRVRIFNVGAEYTALEPRQRIASSPYSIRSKTTETADTAANASVATNALQLGGVTAIQFVQTGDPRLTDARSPTAGSVNYIQNQNSVPQTATNFSISGNGSVSGNLFGGAVSGNIVNATTQFNISNIRVLSIGGTGNVIVGSGAGSSNTGSLNSFVGANAGGATTTGGSNTFVGNAAGSANTTGSQNAFFGHYAGTSAGGPNGNSFFGYSAGRGTTIGGSNSFFGENSGRINTAGIFNTFLGVNAGDDNITGINNVALGAASNVGSSALNNASAIGTSARTDCSNCMVLGSIAGVNNATDHTNVGIGTTTPSNRLHISAASGNVILGDPGCFAGFAGIGFGTTLSGCANYSLLGNGTDTIINRPTGGTLDFREGNITQVTISAGGLFSIANLGAGGTAVCRNASNQISDCSSSLRYKTNIGTFSDGLDLIKRLRPITFDWKDGGMHDLGLGAEDVAAIEPLLVTHNKLGEVEGVKYDRIGVVLINAVKEQQEQIELLQQQVQTQQLENEALKAYVCLKVTNVEFCQSIK